MSKIKIACLPVAGIENPYQSLMIEGLNSSDMITAFSGVDNRFFGIIMTWLKYKPHYIHFDWISSYFVRRNIYFTIVLLPLFYVQIFFISKFTSTQLVWTAHNLISHKNQYPIIERLTKIFFVKNIKWVRVFSERSIDQFSSRYKINKDKFIVVPEGDYRSLYVNNSSKYESRIKLGLNHDDFILLNIGFIKPYKGLEELITLFKKNRLTNHKLMIAGKPIEDDYFQKIKHLAKSDKNIEIIENFIEPNFLQFYFNSADLVVFPFKAIENSGSVIMAMGYSKPVLAPKIGAIINRLNSQKELLYDDLESGLLHALKMDKEKLSKLGKGNLNALAKYQWKDFSSAFLEWNK